MTSSTAQPPKKLRFLLASHNKGKIREIQAALAGLPVELQSLWELPELPEREENTPTFAGNARLKAQYYNQRTGVPCLADDSGLVVDALNGAPGVYSSRFAPTDEERISRLLSLLKHVKSGQRSARFVCALCLFSGSPLIEVQGEVEGFIAASPRGRKGFGYDPVFYYPPLKKTFAELSLEKKNEVSHRARALEKLREQLVRLLG